MKTLHCFCFWSALFISDHRWIVQPLATPASDQRWVNSSSRHTMWVTNFHLQNMFTPLMLGHECYLLFLSPGLDFPSKGSWRALGAPALPAYVRVRTHTHTNVDTEPPTSPLGRGLASYKSKPVPRKEVWAARHSCFMLPMAPRLWH